LNILIEVVPPTLALLGIVVGWGFYSSSLILNPSKSRPEAAPGVFGLTPQEVAFDTTDGIRLKGWFVSAPGSSKTVIACHGWSAERSSTLACTSFLRRVGYNLLYFDFRNHGESGGTLSSVGPLESRDLEAALGFLSRHKTDAARWIGVWGLSMGAVVAIAAAADHPEIKAVVAESAFSSFNEAVIRSARFFYGVPRFPLMAITLGFVRWRLGFDPEKFSPLDRIGRIRPRPVLLIQGDRDVRAPASDGRLLFEAAGEPKELWTVPGADHGEAHSKDPVTYEKKVSEFFDKASQGAA